MMFIVECIDKETGEILRKSVELDNDYKYSGSYDYFNVIASKLGDNFKLLKGSQFK